MFTLIIEDKHGAIVDEYSFEDGEFIVGRSQQADIVLPADNVSRRHARLFTVDGRCYIEDLKAANGVWLNGKRIYNITELPRSAQVRIGDFFLHIEGAAYARPLGASVYARLIPMPGSIGELTDLAHATVLIGRGKDCAVVLSDVSVSRIHAKITQDQAGRVAVEDLRSSNGTYVNDRRVDQQELQHGDRIRFGTVAFAYQVDGMPEIEVEEPAYVPSPRSAPRLQAQYSQYSAYAPAEAPLSAVDAAYAPAPRSVLPQVAAVAVILVAVVGLVILVGLAYDRWVGPALEARRSVAIAPAPAPRPVPQPEVADAASPFDDLVERGTDAIARRQWDEAEGLFKKARRIDPISTKPTEALNMIAMEKRAGARFAQAEEAFARKDLATAIQQHRMIPQSSVYRADANAALDAIAQVLELEGDALAAAKSGAACQEKYRQALSTGFAKPAVEQKYLKALKVR
jgi:pSer/pThr/pTyr-binding forkhead associated (FHA) protein